MVSQFQKNYKTKPDNEQVYISPLTKKAIKRSFVSYMLVINYMAELVHFSLKRSFLIGSLSKSQFSSTER